MIAFLLETSNRIGIRRHHHLREFLHPFHQQFRLVRYLRVPKHID